MFLPVAKGIVILGMESMILIPLQDFYFILFTFILFLF